MTPPATVRLPPGAMEALPRTTKAAPLLTLTAVPPSAPELFPLWSTTRAPPLIVVAPL